jgi:hypothetical protein
MIAVCEGSHFSARTCVVPVTCRVLSVRFMASSAQAKEPVVIRLKNKRNSLRLVFIGGLKEDGLFGKLIKTRMSR